MSEVTTESSGRDPYGKKMSDWEKSLDEIESLADLSLYDRILFHNKFLQKRDDLAKISAGIKKAMETLSYSNDFSDPARCDTLQHLIKLGLRVKKAETSLYRADVIESLKEKIRESLKDD